jgi:5'-nucleotidase
VVNDLDAEVAGPGEWPTDVAHVNQGGVALTPLQPELFWMGDTAALPQLD